MKKFKEIFTRKPLLYKDADFTVYHEVGSTILVAVTDVLRNGGIAIGGGQSEMKKKERLASYFVGVRHPEYRNWWTKEFVKNEFCSISQDGLLNSFFSLLVLVMLIIVITGIDAKFGVLRKIDVVYNLWYAVVVASVAAAAARQRHPGEPISCSMKVGFLMDLVSFAHYLPLPHREHLKIVCYFIRVHRPLRFIWATDCNNMNGSLLVTALKYMYYTLLLRVVCAYFWIIVDTLQSSVQQDSQRRMLHAATPYPLSQLSQAHGSTVGQSWDRWEMLNALYLVNKIFIPIGPSVNPNTDFERVVFLVVMTIGVLVVTGAAVAALSSVISIYMRPEENFRTRYRIIMRDMTSSGIPISLRNKVETFYKMYWHKQRAVSATQLLPSFPPVLPKSVYMDIYFEATQKSGVLRDLSYHFLSEVAKNMETILYIPGDSIIKRNSHKNSIIYITYGDIEMLTAEDDISPMLRFTRGTILTPWGACPAGGGRAHVQIRAATFCAAHALPARGLWRAALRHGRGGQTRLMLAELRAHLDKVKRHYATRKSPKARYKSSILEFKKSLMALKEARDENGELLLARPDYFLDIAGCYFMRNRTDATLTDDSDAICLRQTFPCILQPSSSLLTAWNWLVAGVIVIVCFTYPYYLIYKKTIPLNFRFFDLMVTVVYVLDIIVYLSTGANVEEGVPITFMQTSALQVRSPWFVLDVLGIFPIFTFIDEGQFAGLIKILRFPKVIRVIHSLEEECVYHSNVVRFFSYALILIFACYFLAALQQAFVCYGYGYCVVTNFTHGPFWTEAPLDDATVDDRLYFSLYWAISVLTFTSHMELVGPIGKDYTVLIYTTLILEVCIVLHICIEAVYSATIMVTTAFRENYDSCIVDVRNFLISHKVAPQLRQRFVDHLLLSWNTRKAYSMSSKQSSVFYDLPPHVYQDILARQRSKYMLCIPFMKLLHKEDLKNVSSNARQFYTAPNEILLNTGDISTEMYIIKQGFCEVLNPDTKEVVGTLVAKSHFGVLECLLRFPAFYTVRATTHVQLFSISRKYLTQALEIPQIKDAINFAMEQEEYSRLQVRREPFVSYRPPARVPNRQLFRLPRKHEKDSAFLQPFKNFGFFSILKNVFPRFTFRPDSELLMRYEICRAFCAFAGAFIFPSYTYMVLQFPWLYHLALVLDLCAYFDISSLSFIFSAFRMLVGYFDANGILVYHPANTAARYLRGAFLMDAFSCLPLETLEVSRKNVYGKMYQVTAMKQILMLNRLLQLYRLPGTLGVLTSRIERRDIILVLQALPLFLTMLNVLTSLLVFSSVKIYHSIDELKWDFVPMDDPGGSWIYLYKNVFRFDVIATPLQLHLGCYFWIVYEATATGYNTIAPTNLNIMAVLFGAMVLGSLIMIYMSVRIISIRANVNKVLAAYQEHMKDLVQFMQREKLDTQLQKEIVDHYQFNWVKTGGVDARNVLKFCDQIALRSDAILHIYGPAFAKCPILADCDVSLLRVLGRAVRSIHFLEGTTIFQEDDIIDHLYFVYHGHLQLQTFNWTDGTNQVTTLAIGSMVGNLDDTPTARVSSRLVAATDVHLLQMSSVAFHHIVRYCDFPVVYELIAKYRFNNEMFIDADVNSRWQPTSRRRTSDITSSKLHHRSNVIQVYLIIISMVCAYTDLYNAGFQDNRVSVLAALYVLDACFVIKVLLYLMLPELMTLLTEDEEIGGKAAYFKSEEFKYDVASCLPVEIFCLLSSNPWLFLSWLRLNRTLRLKTVSKYLKSYQKRATENLSLSTLALVVWFTLYVHCCTCLWFFIGLLGHWEVPRSSWFYDDNGEPLCSSKYLCSVYFVLTSFSQNGVSDVMPKKLIEVLYVSLFSILSTMVYVVYVGEFSNIVHYASFRAFSYYSKFLELQEFLKNNRVSPVLVALVNKYSVLLWREARGEQLPAFLVSAPLCLKLKVMSHAYKEVGEQHPVFKNCESALLRQVVGYLRQYYYDENMYVVKQNEITDSMYLVHTGEVQEIRESEDDEESEGQKGKLYTAGEYFGVEQGFRRDRPFHYSYRTTVKSQILTLRLDDWEYLLKHFPDSKELIDNYQWTNKDDDDDDDIKGFNSDAAPPMYRLDPFETLGSPGGSEIALPSDSQGPSDGPSPRPPSDGHRRKPSGGKSAESTGRPTSKMAPLIEIKRSSMKPSKSESKKLAQKDKSSQSASHDVGDKTLSTDPDTNDGQLKEVFSKEASTESMTRNQKSVVWAPKKTTKISLTSEEYRLEESLLLDASSSTQLFERIRKAALAVDEAAAKHGADDDDNTSVTSLAREDSEVIAVTIPHHSVEEYLAHKFKMRESYAVTSYHKRDHEHKTVDHLSRSSIHESRMKYLHHATDRPGREDYRHSQLAETASSAQTRSPQSHSFSTVNLDRPLVDRTPSPASASTNLGTVRPVEQETTSIPVSQQIEADVVPFNALPSEQVDTQVTQSSKQVNLGETPELQNYEEKHRTDDARTIDNIPPETKVVDFDSDVAARMVAASAPNDLPTSLSDAVELDRINSSSTSLNTVKTLVPTSSRKVNDSKHLKIQDSQGSTSSKPTVTRELSETKTEPEKEPDVLSANVIPDLQLVDYDSDVAAHMYLAGSTPPPATELLAILPATSTSEPPSPPALRALPAPPLRSEQPTPPALSILPEALTQQAQLIQSYLSSFVQSLMDSVIVREPVSTQPVLPALPEPPPSMLPLDSMEPNPSIKSLYLLDETEHRTSVVAPREDQVTELVALSPAMPAPPEPTTPPAQLPLLALPAPPSKEIVSEQTDDTTGLIPREMPDKDSDQKPVTVKIKDASDDAKLAPAALLAPPSEMTALEHSGETSEPRPKETSQTVDDSDKTEYSKNIKDTSEAPKASKSSDNEKDQDNSDQNEPDENKSNQDKKSKTEEDKNKG